MSSQSTPQNITDKVEEMADQAQMKKDEMMSQTSMNSQSSDQNAREQMKNMAQGAAEAVKNTLGMNNATNNASNVPDTNHPIRVYKHRSSSNYVNNLCVHNVIVVVSTIVQPRQLNYSAKLKGVVPIGENTIADSDNDDDVDMQMVETYKTKLDVTKAILKEEDAGLCFAVDSFTPCKPFVTTSYHCILEHQLQLKKEL
ncbi:hypothetical protein Gohar_003424, partial [Gossypium harknessii]|nr:hypothetical protein [Gossypium harknessii]